MLKKFALITLVALTANCAWAADDIKHFSINELLVTSKAKGALNADIQLFFGTNAPEKVLETYGEVISNKKTNAFNKSDKEACEWVMLSALKALQQRAVKEGMNAVINIQSYYKKNEFISNEEFECGAGTLMAGVALKGTLVKL